MKKVLKKRRRQPVVDLTARRRIAALATLARDLDANIAAIAEQKRELARKVRTVEEAAERILTLRQAAIESTEADLNSRLLHENQSLLEVVSTMRRVLIENGLLR